jgi:Fic family protein
LESGLPLSIIKEITDASNETNNNGSIKITINSILENPKPINNWNYHFILKNGTLTDEESKWFNVGEYKKKKNFVGNITTSSPENVANDMKKLLNWYNDIKAKTFEDIIEFHVRFEKIHPFQDGNGRVGRMIIFKECLCNNIMPFYIEDRNKEFYIRGIKEYQNNNIKGYLIDTCLNSQDNYEKMVHFFLDND